MKKMQTIPTLNTMMVTVSNNMCEFKSIAQDTREDYRIFRQLTMSEYTSIAFYLIIENGYLTLSYFIFQIRLVNQFIV